MFSMSFGFRSGRVAVEQHAVDDVQRALSSTTRVDGRGAAEDDRRCGAGPAAGCLDVGAGDLALELLHRVAADDRHLRRVHVRHGERDVPRRRSRRHAGDDDFTQPADVFFELEVHGLAAGGEAHWLGDRLVADGAHAQLHRLSAHALAGYGDGDRPAAFVPTEMFISVMNTLAPWSGCPRVVSTRPPITAPCPCALPAAPAIPSSPAARKRNTPRDRGVSLIVDPLNGW